METFCYANIMTLETKVKVVFEYKINNFGFLISDTLKDIEPGVKVDVPLYIAQFLLENNHCTLCTPVLSEDTKNDFKANSSIINLGSMYNYFYYFLIYFSSHEYVLEIMFSRYSVLYKLILKEQLDEDDIFMLDFSEKRIIATARKIFLSYRNYFINN